jgi:hypothetical protein
MEDLSVKVLSLTAVVLLSACGPKDGPAFKLEGSLTSVLDLGYDHVWLDNSESDFSVRFARIQGEGENTPLKVTVTLLPGELPGPNVTWDLAETLPNGQQRGVLSRNVLNEAVIMFPEILRGKLTMFQTPMAIETGAPASGEFNITFVTGIMPANGRTIFGTYSAKVP